MYGVFEVSHTALHTKTLYYKRGFFDNISFLFFRKIALPITLVILLFVVFIVVMKKRDKLSKNILFYILQRHGSEPGKMASNFRRGSESEGGGSCFRI
jgi:hypothetical protein